MTTSNVLPGPRTPGLYNSIEFALSPSRFAARHGRTYGRVYRAKTALRESVYTSHPEHVRRIFGADEDAFDSYTSLVVPWLWGDTSVVLTAGATHRRQRKLLSPPLSGARLRAFGTTMQTIAEQHVARLRAGDTLSAHAFAAEFTLEVILRTVFGVRSDQDEAEARELRRLLTSLVHDVPILSLYARPLQHGLYPPWARYMQVREKFRRWLGAKIAETQAAGAQGDDVLSLLLSARHDDGSAMDDAEVQDQLLTLLLTGHETTAVGLACCLSRLHREPRVLATLRAELDAAASGPDELARLPYLSAVIDETLRIDPILTDVGRLPRADFALDAQTVVTPRQILVVLIEALHHDPELYPDPARFRPERFLERRYAPYEYAPFGGGVRRCLGAAFADYETKVLLATLLRHTELELESQRPEPRVRLNITMGPKRGVPLRVLRVR